MLYVFLSVWVFGAEASSKESEIITDTIFPSMDTYIDAMNPETNFGNGDTLELGYADTPLKSILIWFDMPFGSESPDSITVDEARIELFSHSSTEGSEVMTSAPGQEWAEQEVTCNTRPGPGSAMGVSSYLDDQPGWQSINVAPFVQAFASDALTNYGFEIMPLFPSNFEFASKECADTSLKPRLYLSYHFEGTSTGEFLPEAVGLEVPVISTNLVAIRYAIPFTGEASLTIYDASGRMAERMIESRVSPGRHSTEWNAPKPGVYFVSLDISGFSSVKRMVVVR